jgi:hypothetical protein
MDQSNHNLSIAPVAHKEIVKLNRKRREHEQDLGRLGHAPRAATGTQTGEKEMNCNHGPNQTEENKIEADPGSGEI